MRRKTLSLLRCIECDSIKLKLEINKSQEIVSGFIKCENCGAVYKIMNGIPNFLPKNFSPDVRVKVFDVYTERYDFWFESKGRILFENEVEALRCLLNGINMQLALEIGVGTGRFAKALKIPYGVDPAFHALKKAKERGIEVVLGIAEKLPFRSSIFDAAFLIVTICYVRDIHQVFKETNRILKNGGFVIVAFINRESPWGKEYIEKKKRGHIFYEPAKFYSFNEISNLLNQYGFRVEKVVSTLRQLPFDKPIREKPIIGYDKRAGFVGILAKKTFNVY